MTEFDLIWTDEEKHEAEKESYNQALEDIFNLAKQNAYDDGVDYSISLQVLDGLIEQLKEQINE